MLHHTIEEAEKAIGKEFCTERALLGEDYLLGNVLLHVSSNHPDRPCAVSFNLYKANSADKAGFDIVIHANAASEEVFISRESKSALAAAGNQNVVHLDEFRETLTALEAPMKN